MRGAPRRGVTACLRDQEEVHIDVQVQVLGHRPGVVDSGTIGGDVACAPKLLKRADLHSRLCFGRVGWALVGGQMALVV